MAIVKLVFIFALICCAFFFDVEISLSFMGESWPLPLWEVLVLLFLFVCVYNLYKIILEKLVSVFDLKPDLIKGINYLQQAFSGMLIKDHKVVLNSLKKAKKHLGEIPFISWLEGQLYLIDGDTYKAKSLFFNLSSKEKDTVLGAYSLAQLSLQEKSDRESAEAIKAILEIYPNSRNFLNQIISLSLKNGNTNDALYYLRKLSDDNRKNIEAVIYFEKWRQSFDQSDLKTAYKLAPQISDIAITYADDLLKRDEKKSAGKVLLRSFERSQTIDIFKKYISLDDEKIKRAEKLMKAAPQSWIPYFYLAKFCVEEDMLPAAADYISRAYELAQYNFIAEELMKINSLRNNDDELIDLSQAKNVKFLWRCNKCGNHSSSWQSICACCMSVASYEYVEETEENLPTIV